MMHRRLICVVALGWSLAVCGAPPNAQKLRDEVLRADPRFADVLEKRDEQANRIVLLEREFDLKKTQAQQQIKQLRDGLDEARRQVDQKIQKSKALLKPDLERLELAVSMAGNELRAKRSQRASLGGNISRLKKSLKGGQVQWSESEGASMARDLNELLEEAKRLDGEIAALNEHIRLLKIKRLLLRL